MDRSARVSFCPPPGISVLDGCSLRSQVECVKQSDLRDLRAAPDAGTRSAVRRVDVADVESDNLGEPEAVAEGQAVDQVVAVVDGHRAESVADAGPATSGHETAIARAESAEADRNVPRASAVGSSL